MHVRDLVEVAGIVAYHGPSLVRTTQAIPQAPLAQYWATSRCRLENWHRTLKQYSTLAALERPLATDDWLALRSTLDEIFVSEILCRVWTAVLVGRERRQGGGSDEPLARSTFQSHMDARQRALVLLLHSQAFTTEQAVSINRLRRRAERWSDLLLGGLVDDLPDAEFAVDPDRAREFGDDLLRRRQAPGGRQAWRLTLVSLRGAFQSGLAPQTANADANARITASILGCFSSELFDSTGLVKSLWMTRLSAVASDAEGLIRDLLREERPAAPPVAHRIPRRKA